MSENKRQDGMIEDLHERCDKSQGDTFSKGLKAEQGATTKLQAMQFHIICPQFISMNFFMSFRALPKQHSGGAGGTSGRSGCCHTGRSFRHRDRCRLPV